MSGDGVAPDEVATPQRIYWNDSTRGLDPRSYHPVLIDAGYADLEIPGHGDELSETEVITMLRRFFPDWQPVPAP